VVDKPAGKPTSSTDGSISIQDIVSEYLGRQSKGRIRAFVVHRLDKEVSGVLIFAKSHDVMEVIKENWKETEKHYYALVEGIPGKAEGTIKSWLIEDKSQKVRSTSETANAKFAVTSYRTLKRMDKYGLLDIKTDTGRKNQIRVHLSDIGCPIVGDRKYGASGDYKRRIRLHAYSLSFPHPVDLV
jgi:23S rRNA-/tRNA-specific pseudouridylate synthase